jgi:hypothetical protein
MFAGILLATSALAAQPVIDPQRQARQFILAKPNFGAASNSKAKVVAAVPAQGNPRGDAQEQARQFILAKPDFAAAIDSKTKMVAVVPAQGNPRVDAQEQAREFIVGKPNFGDLAGRVLAPVSKLKVTQGPPARSNRGRYSDSR